MDHEQEMEDALAADGEKLRALTGEDHGPWVMDEYGHMIPDSDHIHAEVAELREQLATARAALVGVTDAFLDRHGCFPLENEKWHSAMKAAYENVGGPHSLLRSSAALAPQVQP